jgi:hypothetical protein
MIYLKKHNLLFIKPLKTASTSVEIAFSCNADADDIVTPISMNDELLRLEKGGQLPVNYSKSRLSEWIYRARVRFLGRLKKKGVEDLAHRNEVLKSIFRGGKRRVVYNHIKPTELMKRKGDSFFMESFVVTMCRHPYDVLLSRVYWERYKKGGSSEFDLEKVTDEMLENEPLNLDYCFLDGRFFPDFVIRYEHMQDDLRELEDTFGLSLVDHLPFTKNKVRKEKKSAADVLTERQKADCYEKNRLIFEKFGYEK